VQTDKDMLDALTLSVDGQITRILAGILESQDLRSHYHLQTFSVDWTRDAARASNQIGVGCCCAARFCRMA
jgi:hypothetical protein